jgi:hypothetical protein
MRKIAALLVLTGLVVVFVVAGTSQAKTPACDGTKIEPVVSGTYAAQFGGSAGSITITTNGLDAGGAFGFQTDDPSHIVTTVSVKGGSGLPLSYTVNSWTGSDLHADLNPNTGTWYGLSYVCFETAEAPADGGGGSE